MAYRAEARCSALRLVSGGKLTASALQVADLIGGAGSRTAAAATECRSDVGVAEEVLRTVLIDGAASDFAGAVVSAHLIVQEAGTLFVAGAGVFTQAVGGVADLTGAAVCVVVAREHAEVSAATLALGARPAVAGAASHIAEAELARGARALFTGANTGEVSASFGVQGTEEPRGTYGVSGGAGDGLTGPGVGADFSARTVVGFNAAPVCTQEVCVAVLVAFAVRVGGASAFEDLTGLGVSLGEAGLSGLAFVVVATTGNTDRGRVGKGAEVSFGALAVVGALQHATRAVVQVADLP